MLLPDGAKAFVDLEKLTQYCLNATHPRGRHKARVFRATLGLTAENAEELRERLLAAAQTQEVVESFADEHGVRYVLDFP